jgi:hypothetical protein
VVKLIHPLSILHDLSLVSATLHEHEHDFTLRLLDPGALERIIEETNRGALSSFIVFALVIFSSVAQGFAAENQKFDRIRVGYSSISSSRILRFGLRTTWASSRSRA